jgi:hypothetical protein
MIGSTEFLFTISSIIHYLALAFVSVGGFLLFIKKRTLATTMLLVGAILMVITTIVGIGIQLYPIDEDFEAVMRANASIAILSSISFGLFCLGIFLYALDFKKEVPKNEFLD